MIKVAFCQKVQWGSKKYSKSLSWAENLNKLFTFMGGKFNFSAQGSDLEYSFEPHQTFWQKATFKWMAEENSSKKNAAKICYLDQSCFTMIQFHKVFLIWTLNENILLNSDSINLFNLRVDYIESSVVNPFGVPADVALHSSSPYHHRKGG